MTKPRYPRTSCCVPFCRRTSTLFRDEWVCGEHWRLVDRSLKRLRSTLRRRWVKRWRAAQYRRRVDLNIAWRRVEAAIWRRMKRQAIERAAGASA